MATKRNKKRQVIITTERRGVFYGTLESYDEKARTAVLSDCIMAIRWGTTDGLFQLCKTGPTTQSKLSLSAPRGRFELVECVLDVLPEAEQAWKRYAR